MQTCRFLLIPSTYLYSSKMEKRIPQTLWNTLILIHEQHFLTTSTLYFRLSVWISESFYTNSRFAIIFLAYIFIQCTCGNFFCFFCKHAGFGFFAHSAYIFIQLENGETNAADFLKQINSHSRRAFSYNININITFFYDHRTYYLHRSLWLLFQFIFTYIALIFDPQN